MNNDNRTQYIAIPAQVCFAEGLFNKKALFNILFWVKTSEMCKHTQLMVKYWKWELENCNNLNWNDLLQDDFFVRNHSHIKN